MKSKRGWVILSLLLIAGFLGAGASLLYGGNVFGGFLLAGALYLAKDLVNLGAASKARELRRTAYAESGVWRTAECKGSPKESRVVTVPSDRYFESVLDESPATNPATGLFMIGSVAGIDLAGNPYGSNEVLEPGFGATAEPEAGLDAWAGDTDLTA